MKRSFKCYGLLLASLIIFGLSLSVSSNTNALKYTLDYIPFTVPNPVVNNGIDYYQSFLFEGTYDNNSAFLKDLGYYINAEWSSERNQCIYLSSRSVNPTRSYYDIPFFIQPPSDFQGTVPDFTPCSTDEAFDSINRQGVSSTIPSLSYEYLLRSYLPYRYDINGAFLRSTASTDGLNRSTKLDFSSLFENNQVPDSVNHLRIPIGLSEVTFSPGESIEFSGSFYFDSKNPSVDVLTFHPDATLKIYGNFSSDYSAYVSSSSSGVYYSVNSTCSLSSSVNSDVNLYPFILSYSCSLTAPSYLSSYSLSGFYLDFTSSYGNPVWTLPNITVMMYDGSFVITNHDETPATSPFQSFTIHSSSSLDNVPGYVGSLPGSNNCSEDDWFCQLTNLFTFNFINPFAPIFNLFTNNDSCASIPTLASMLHSNETQVCPWFDSSTRAIVTPILGISSMMLVFGFAVRWLGSSSGNLFEDSKHEEVSNQGGRWGHFKKGGK